MDHGWNKTAQKYGGLEQCCVLIWIQGGQIMALPPHKKIKIFIIYFGRTGRFVRSLGDFSYSLQVLYADLKRR
jgi:hypothetical protein